MQSTLNFMELFGQDTGVAQAAPQPGFKFGLKAQLDGVRDATGFADIMGAFMRLQAAQEPAALGKFEFAAVQAAVDPEQAGSAGLSDMQSRREDRILSWLMRARGTGDDIHASAYGLRAMQPIDALPDVQTDAEGALVPADDTQGAEPGTLAGDMQAVAGDAAVVLKEAAVDASEAPAGADGASAERANADGSHRAPLQQSMRAPWPPAAGERIPGEPTGFPSEKADTTKAWIPGDGNIRPDWIRAEKGSAPAVPAEPVQGQAAAGQAAAEQATAQERRAAPPVVKVAHTQFAGGASGNDSNPAAAGARFSGDMPSDEGKPDEGRSHAQWRNTGDGRSAGKVEQGTAFVPPTTSAAAPPAASAGGETQPTTADFRGIGSESRLAQKSDGTASDPGPVAKDVQTDVLRQIVQRMTMRTDGRQSQMQIQLKPEFLGNLRMQVITENQQVTIRMVAASSAVKQMIEQNSHVLRAELQQHGLQVQKLEVTVAPDSEAWQNGQSPNTFGQSRERGGNEGRRREGGALGAGDADEVKKSAAGAAGYRATGEVDFFA